MSDKLRSPATDPTLQKLPGAERTIPRALVSEVLGFDELESIVLTDQSGGKFFVENPAKASAGYTPNTDPLPEGLAGLVFQVHDTADEIAHQVLAVAYERGDVRKHVLRDVLTAAGVYRPSHHAVKIRIGGLEDDSTVTLSSSPREDGGRATRLRIVRPGDGDTAVQSYDISWGTERPKHKGYPPYPWAIDLAVASGTETNTQAGVISGMPADVERFSGALGALQETLGTLKRTTSGDMKVTADGLFF